MTNSATYQSDSGRGKGQNKAKEAGANNKDIQQLPDMGWSLCQHTDCKPAPTCYRDGQSINNIVWCTMKMSQDADEAGDDSYSVFRTPSAVSHFACPQEFINWDGETDSYCCGTAVLGYYMLIYNCSMFKEIVAYSSGGCSKGTVRSCIF